MRRAWDDMTIMRAMMLLALTAAAQATCGSDSECTPIDNIPNTKTTAFTACNSTEQCKATNARCEQADQVRPSVPCDAQSPTGDTWCDSPYCDVDNYCKCDHWLRPNGGCIIKDEGKTFRPLSANATQGLAGFAFIYLIIWACLLFIGTVVYVWRGKMYSSRHKHWWTASVPFLAYYIFKTMTEKDFDLEFDNGTTPYALRANQPRKLKGVQLTEL